jgi:hypothetical protein
MFEKVSQMAERMATNASRRQFLVRLGQAAAGAAGFLGGILLMPRDVQAAKRCHGVTCPPGYNYCCSYFDTLVKQKVWYCSYVPC